jgi:hypothetical protein
MMFFFIGILLYIIIEFVLMIEEYKRNAKLQGFWKLRLGMLVFLAIATILVLVEL